jgi:tRNA(Met) cytidine acetyltransferase
VSEWRDGTARLQCQGWRRLLVLSGTAQWSEQQAAGLMEQLPGDWLWVGEPSHSVQSCAPSAIRTLLGREFHHAVFDARSGFHAEALAALAGTLQAGSWLLLLVPEWDHWAQQPDEDSLRWSERDAPCATPRFIQRLQQLIQADARAVLWRENHPLILPVAEAVPQWLPDDGSLQQQQILAKLLHASPGVQAITAARGRGKSALAGMLAARWPGRCLVTAPGKVSTEVLAQFAGDAFHFIAPDRLLAEAALHQPGVDWLLIDEAAAIPAPLLHQLVALFPRVLLTTTVQGYEGTGRGFLLKFCAALPNVTLHQLDTPLRWAANDPLESFISDALLFDDREVEPQHGSMDYVALEQPDWGRQPARMAAVYQLLTSAHYRTSPLDLRRMMDASGMHFSAALQGDSVQGALWLVDEGGLSAALSSAVWAGTRRPRGNLVAQSLAAHAGQIDAPQLRSRRISRIAVAAALRGQGIGQQLVAGCQQQAQGLDYLSVSFGFTSALWQFWQRCGFQLVRIGSVREASSGCFSAMAILPLSPAGQQLAQRAAQRFERAGAWLRRQLPGEELPLATHCYADIDEDDWRELAGFAWAQRPFEASLAALGRLVSQRPCALPLLSAALLQQQRSAEVIARAKLSGRKALLAAQRQEARQGLMALDAQQADRWRQWLDSLQ